MIPEGSDDVSKNDTASRGPIKSKEGYEDVEKGMTPSTNTSKESAASSTSDHMPQTARPGEEDQDFCNRMDLPPISVPRNLKSLIEAMQSGDKKVQSDDKMLQPNDERKKRRQGYLTKNIFKPQVSSFVLATNAFGDFSKCTIFSQLLKDSDLKVEIADRAERLWREFVHQPQTGRCLVFLQVLQVITRKVIGQYRRTLTILLSVLDLDVCICLFNFPSSANITRTISASESKHGRKILMPNVYSNFGFGASRLCTNFNVLLSPLSKA